MSFFSFLITSFTPTPIIGQPPFVFLTGTCATNLLQGLTVCSTGTKFFSGSVDPNLASGAFAASSKKYTILCDALAAMGTGSVQMTVTYNVVNNLFQVIDLSCNLIPAGLPGVQQQLAVIATNSTLIEQRLASDLSGGVLAELRTLNGLVTEVLGVIRQETGAAQPVREPDLKGLRSDIHALAPNLEEAEEKVG